MTLKLWLLAGLALLLGLSASIYINSSHNTEVVSGAELAAIELPGVDGSQVDINALQGKLVLVNFWATWCPPCLQEIPVFLALRKKYAATGFEVLGVSIDKASKVMQYRQTLKINYPLLDGEKTGMALMQSLGNNIGGLPFSVLFDRSGKAVAVKSGAYQEQELIDLIEKYL
jgi:thiol-disulfide isomerase/thioredoxin